MSDKTPTAPVVEELAPPALVPVVAAPSPAPTPDFRAAEQVIFNRRLASEDKARAKAATLTLVAIASFTLVVDELGDDGEPAYPDGKVVKAGEEFEISAFDLPRFAGRGRLKSLDDPNRAGVTSIRE